MRRKNLPPESESAQDLKLEGKWCQVDGEDWVIHENTQGDHPCIILATKVNIRYLRQSSVWYGEKIFKVKNFYETTVLKLTPRVFQCYFCMHACTLAKLTNFIERNRFIQPQTITSIPLAKHITMMTAYLGSQWPTMQ